MDGFEKMLFELNEWLHNAGILNAHQNITGVNILISIIATIILMVAYEKIVVGSAIHNKYAKYIPNVSMAMIVIAGIIMMGVGIYFQKYAEVLFFTLFITAELAIGKLDIFKNFRAYLDKKLGWLF